jgi:hypothetical protein
MLASRCRFVAAGDQVTLQVGDRGVLVAPRFLVADVAVMLNAGLSRRQLWPVTIVQFRVLASSRTHRDW